MTRTLMVEVHKPSWQWRAVCTALVLLFSWVALYAYNAVQGPMEAQAAVAQLQDSNEAYAIARTWAAANLQLAVRCLTTATVGLLWGSYVGRMRRYRKAKSADA